MKMPTTYMQSLQRQIVSTFDERSRNALYAELWFTIEIHHRLAAIETYLDLRDSLALPAVVSCER
jgi:hypothetical protein